MIDYYNLMGGSAGTDVPQDWTGAFIITITIPSTVNITLPLIDAGTHTYEFWVDWGDSNYTYVDAYTSPAKAHLYTAGGTYTIRMLGTLTGWSTPTYSIRNYITTVNDWGLTGFLSFQMKGSTALTSIPADTAGSFSTLVGVSGANFSIFEGCSSLLSLPTGLCDYMTNLTNMTGFAKDCTSLTSIGAGLLDNLTGLQIFSDGFRNTAITTIPTGLFDNNVALTNMTGVFYFCQSLTSIPSGLYTNLTNVTTYAITHGNNISLTGNAPELWNLVPEPTGTQCFLNCTGLTNYASIPANWK